MLANTNLANKNSIKPFISISVLLHVTVFGIFLFSSFFSDRAVSIDGDSSIKAIMIDLSQIAAPEQSMVENSPQIDGVEEQPIIDDNVVEITPDKAETEFELEPDLIVEKDIIEKIEQSVEPELIIKEQPAKPKENKNKQPIQKLSTPQIKQDVIVDKLADIAIAPAISTNTQYSVSPTPISRNQPEYPRRALDMRIEGHVIVVYDIDHNGRIENIRIIESKPNNIFNKSVIHAMKQWKYQPIKAKDLTIKIVFNRNKTIKLEST